MALFAYLQQTQRLLHDKISAEFNTADLTAYVNTARGQVAGEGQCVRGLTVLSTQSTVQSYAFSSANLVTGIAGILNLRMIYRSAAGIGIPLIMRPWEWFVQYYAGTTATGTPTTWAQLGQGQNGTFLLYPMPSGVFPLSLDAVFSPADLITDTDQEAVPYPWTDAVPYYAAYLAMLSLPDEKSRGHAAKLWEQYTEFMARARRTATPTVLPRNMPMPGIVQPAITARQGG
jgi:hypothetical protein